MAKTTTVKGYYTYNNGKPGWVEAELIDGRFSCLHYWDRVDCRKLGQGLGTQLEAAAAEAERNQRLHPTRTTPSPSREPSYFNLSLCVLGRLHDRWYGRLSAVVAGAGAVKRVGEPRMLRQATVSSLNALMPGFSPTSPA